MTNKGLRLELFLAKAQHARSSSFDSTNEHLSPFEYLAPLNCGQQENASDDIFPVAIRLRQQQRHQYLRVHGSGLESWNPLEDSRKPSFQDQSLTREIVYIIQPTVSESHNLKYSELSFHFSVKTAAIGSLGYSLSENFGFCPNCNTWTDDDDEPVLTISDNTFCNRHDKDCGALLFSKKGAVSFAVVLQVNNLKYPRANVLVPGNRQSLKEAIDNFHMTRTQSEQSFLLDRASKTIQGGLTVSIALRPTVLTGA